MSDQPMNQLGPLLFQLVSAADRIATALERLTSSQPAVKAAKEMPDEDELVSPADFDRFLTEEQPELSSDSHKRRLHTVWLMLGLSVLRLSRPPFVLCPNCQTTTLGCLNTAEHLFLWQYDLSDLLQMPDLFVFKTFRRSKKAKLAFLDFRIWLTLNRL